MFDIAKTPQNSGIPAQGGRYFKLQIRAWTDFDPMDKNLSEITEAIEQGGGLLTAIEVLTVEEDLAASSDNDEREGVQNILDARRVLGSVGELPKRFVADDRATKRAEEEVAERRPGS